MDEYGYKKLKAEILIKKIFKGEYYNTEIINSDEFLFIKELLNINKDNKIDIDIDIDKNIGIDKENNTCSKHKFYFNFNFHKSKYLFLRLPDVIGPYDESYRLWIYLIWIKNSDIRPIEFDKADITRPISFVSRDDVVNVIIKYILGNNNIKENINEDWDIYRENNLEINLGFNEILTLKDFLDILFCILCEKEKENNNIDSLKNKGYYYIIEEGYANTYFPSVTCGAISTLKAKSLNILKCKEGIIDYLKKTVNFFENEGILFNNEYIEMISELPKEIRDINLINNKNKNNNYNDNDNDNDNININKNKIENKNKDFI